VPLIQWEAILGDFPLFYNAALKEDMGFHIKTQA